MTTVTTQFTTDVIDSHFCLPYSAIDALPRPNCADEPRLHTKTVCAKTVKFHWEVQHQQKPQLL
jgi:hypothetical protein